MRLGPGPDLTFPYHSEDGPGTCVASQLEARLGPEFGTVVLLTMFFCWNDRQ